MFEHISGPGTAAELVRLRRTFPACAARGAPGGIPSVAHAGVARAMRRAGHE
jgi:hypothetical protein